MKQLRNFLCAAMVFAAVLANAQNFSGYKSSTVFSGGTNIVAALTTNGFFSIEVPRAYPDVLLFCSFKFNTTAGAGDNSQLHVDLYRGDQDGFETNRWSRWTITGNGTTAVSEILVTNVLTTPRLRAKLANTGTNLVATNIVFRYGFKN